MKQHLLQGALVSVMTFSCVKTAHEVKREQWVQCWHECGKGDNPIAAGIDWWSGEQTCLCRHKSSSGFSYLKRHRLEPEERVKEWDYSSEEIEEEDEEFDDEYLEGE